MGSLLYANLAVGVMVVVVGRAVCDRVTGPDALSLPTTHHARPPQPLLLGGCYAESAGVQAFFHFFSPWWEDGAMRGEGVAVEGSWLRAEANG